MLPFITLLLRWCCTLISQLRFRSPLSPPDSTRMCTRFGVEPWTNTRNEEGGLHSTHCPGAGDAAGVQGAAHGVSPRGWWKGWLPHTAAPGLFQSPVQGCPFPLQWSPGPHWAGPSQVGLRVSHFMSAWAGCSDEGEVTHRFRALIHPLLGWATNNLFLSGAILSIGVMPRGCKGGTCCR